MEFTFYEMGALIRRGALNRRNTVGQQTYHAVDSIPFPCFILFLYLLINANFIIINSYQNNPT